MSSVLILFTKLIGLVLLKIVSNAVFVAIAFFRRTGKELSRSLLTICHFKDAQNKPLKSDCIFGIVVITRFCTQGSGLQHEGSHIVSGPLKNSAFFERVIGEVSVDTVVSWAAKIIHKNSLRISAQNIAFILVHGKDCSSFFNLKKWFHIIPNHQQGKRHLENVQVEAKKDDAVPLTDEYHIRSLVRRNLSHNNDWEDPHVYCAYSQLYTRIIPISRQLTTVDYDSSVKSKLLSKFQYVSSEKEDCSKLLEVGLQTAIKKNLNYIIVINPRAIDLREHLLTETIQLLTGENRNCQVDVVLGITKRCSRISQSKNMQISNSQTESFNGLYLLGLKCSRSLMPKISLLCNNVEWSSISTADRLWRNIYQSFPNWNSVCLRERLEEVFEPLDLLNLQQSTGLLYEHVLNDSISVIIPMGYGHPDDCLDPEDVELTNSKSSNSLVNTIDLAVHNASGKRQIEIIIINSSPVQNNDSRNLTTAGLLITEPFRNIRLRSMVSIHLYYYNPIETNVLKPNRGELIRYAVDHYARGSMLVFVEPGVQLPVNWDSAVYYTLQRPGVGMACFAYRLHLDDKYIHRKSLSWATNCWLASWIVNVQTSWSGIPIVGQPHFIYSHYLRCINGYPQSCRAFHAIDLALASHQYLGDVVVTRSSTSSAGIPADYALRHGAYRTALYTMLLGAARYLGTTEGQLKWALESSTLSVSPNPNGVEHSSSHLPLVKPHYIDGY